MGFGQSGTTKLNPSPMSPSKVDLVFHKKWRNLMEELDPIVKKTVDQAVEKEICDETCFEVAKRGESFYRNLDPYLNQLVKDQGLTHVTLLKDSGERTEFSTGAVRERSGKGFPHMFPVHSMQKLAEHFEAANVKYGDARNYLKGLPLSSFMDSLWRHWAAILSGDRTENHFSALAWNALCLHETVLMIEQGKLPRELDDINHLESPRT